MTTPPVDPRIARAQAALDDPRLGRFGIVFLSRAGLGVIVAAAIGAALFVAGLIPDARMGGLPVIALMGIAGAVIGFGLVIHPRIRGAAEDHTERWLDDLAAPPDTDAGDQ